MANEKRLIDANELMTNMYRSDEQQKTDVWHTSDIEYLVMAQPTVDAVEVVHARWEKASETMPIYRCSICRERNLFKNGSNVLSNYCPNCGAKMDGGNNDA